MLVAQPMAVVLTRKVTPQTMTSSLSVVVSEVIQAQANVPIGTRTPIETQARVRGQGDTRGGTKKPISRVFIRSACSRPPAVGAGRARTHETRLIPP